MFIRVGPLLGTSLLSEFTKYTALRGVEFIINVYQEAISSKDVTGKCESQIQMETQVQISLRSRTSVSSFWDESSAVARDRHRPHPSTADRRFLLP